MVGVRDRIHLWGRRFTITRRFRQEHSWSWLDCWQMSKVHQRHMLTILWEIQREELEITEFVDGLDRWDRLTLERAV
jgi:hypothetical protein